MTTVIGVDPGGTTGWVIYDTFRQEVIEHLEIVDWFEVGQKLETELDAPSGTVTVVIERFTVTATTHKKTVQEEPKDLNGIAKYLTRKYDQKLYIQSASEAKTFGTNEKLKKAGMWFKGGEGHANDASRHALTMMIKTRLLDPKLLLD